VNLEIVTHCWQYPRLLTYHLSSLVLNPPRNVNVTMTVFLTAEDTSTAEVLRFFARLEKPANVQLRAWQLPREKLVRRCIGRNLAALATEADWVWFADCDYVFGEGALDAIPQRVAGVDGSLVFPRKVLIHREHRLGDRAIERVTGGPRIVWIDPNEFAPMRQRYAIGGIQIARGEVVRRLGYHKDSAWHRRPADHWQDTRLDAAFRRILGSPLGTPIDLPNVYRIRHSVRGQDETGVRL